MKLTTEAFSLPAPTGSYKVGTIEYDIVEAYERNLHTQIWYPADDQNTGKRAHYISEPIRKYIKEALNQEKKCISYIQKQVVTNSYYGISVSKKLSNYPAIIFSPGFGVPFYMYTSFLEELASHGFIVIAISHPGCAEPSELVGSQIIPMNEKWISLLSCMQEFEKVANDSEIDNWVVDMQLVIDYLQKMNADTSNFFAHRIDLKNIGAFGHSFGGSAATQLCRRDQRCKAAVDIDGPLFGKDSTHGFDKPYMFLLAGDDTINENEYEIFGGKIGYLEFINRHMKQMDLFFANLKNDKYYTMFKQARHMSYSDIVFIDSEYAKTQQIIYKARHLLVDFFSSYLNN